MGCGPVVYETPLSVACEMLLTMVCVVQPTVVTQSCIFALLVGDCVVDGLSTPESLERSLAPFFPACRCTGSRGQCSSLRTSQASRTDRTVTILHFGCVSGASFTDLS